MLGNIINQRNSTVLNQVGNSRAVARPVTSSFVQTQVSNLGPGLQIPYGEVLFQDSLGYGPGNGRLSTSYPGPIYEKTPVPVGDPSAGIGISYFNIENGSTYFEQAGGSTYYVVV